jgi:hypothetical protein
MVSSVPSPFRRRKVDLHPRFDLVMVTRATILPPACAARAHRTSTRGASGERFSEDEEQGRRFFTGLPDP